MLNSGKSIIINSGSIIIGTGGMINNNADLYMTDSDSDGYSPNSTQYAGSAAGRRRRYLLNSISNLDCYDSNANARPFQAGYFSAHRGDGSFDYNCVGGEQKQWSTTGSATTCFADFVKSLCSTFAAGSTGWVTGVAACGASATYITDPDNPNCSLRNVADCEEEITTTESRQQKCR